MDEKQQPNIQQPTVIIQQSSSNPFQQMGGGASDFNIKDILFLCLSRWPWFVLSIALAWTLSWLYLRTTPKVYTRTAKLLIKSDSKQSIGGISDALSEVGINKNNANISNELIALKAPAIYQELVRQLHLEVRYSRDGKFVEEELYGANQPIIVEFPDLADRAYASLNVNLKGGNITYSNLSFGGQIYEEEVSISAGDTLNTPLGRMLVKTTSSYHSGINWTVMVRRSSIYDVAANIGARVWAYVPQEGASTVDISYFDVSIQRAEDIINAVINLYSKNWVKDKNQVAVATSKFIGERLKVIEEELSDVEDHISDFKSTNLLPDQGTSSGVYLSQSMQTELQVQELNNQVYMCRYVREYVSNEENYYRMLPVNTGIGAGAAESNIAAYNVLLMSRNDVLKQSSLTNPLVIEYDQKLAEQRDLILMSLDNQIRVLNTQIKSIEQRHNQSNSKLVSSHNQSKYLQRINRQQKVKEALYTYLLQKREEIELNQAFIAYNSRLISPPSGSFLPTSPDTKKIKTYSLLAGFGIPFAVVLLMYLLNTKVRGRRDLDKLDTPFVGELPNVEFTKSEKKRALAHSHLIVEADSKNMINEAFRIIRSNLAFMVGPKSKDNSKVVMVTSINAGSGKTFIMANLAASFALTGKKVLVLDLDIRKRSISKYVGRPKQGITTYLSGLIEDWRCAVVGIKDYPNLYMMPAGRSAPNPSELLQDPRLAMLLDEAKKEYDYVFLDCPPAEIVADATIIKPLAEVTMFIVRVGVMERSHLSVIDQYYKDKTFNNLCVILNGSEALHSRYGYYRYGYGYSYGYGYGYGYGYNYGSGYYGETEKEDKTI